jgi:hypothetical protein
MEGPGNEDGAWGIAPRRGGDSNLERLNWGDLEKGSGGCTQGAPKAEGGDEGCN